MDKENCFLAFGRCSFPAVACDKKQCLYHKVVMLEATIKEREGKQS